ncbi:MAG: hypothetical protein D6689_02645 [Deltaproteobacteria bacterium]|nr:MAG: hypothetical protein D6689_02645 [Deltaproteobacteria bacterium]
MSKKTETAQATPNPLDTFAQMSRDGFQRLDAWLAELAELESAMYDQAKELLDYNKSLAAEWRRIALESTRKAADLWAGARA